MPDGTVPKSLRFILHIQSPQKAFRTRRQNLEGNWTHFLLYFLSFYHINWTKQICLTSLRLPIGTRGDISCTSANGVAVSCSRMFPLFICKGKLIESTGILRVTGNTVYQRLKSEWSSHCRRLVRFHFWLNLWSL